MAEREHGLLFGDRECSCLSCHLGDQRNKIGQWEANRSLGEKNRYITRSFDRY